MVSERHVAVGDQLLHGVEPQPAGGAGVRPEPGGERHHQGDRGAAPAVRLGVGREENLSVTRLLVVGDIVAMDPTAPRVAAVGGCGTVAWSPWVHRQRCAIYSPPGPRSRTSGQRSCLGSSTATSMSCGSAGPPNA
jgi:hypothetical protein